MKKICHIRRKAVILPMLLMLFMFTGCGNGIDAIDDTVKDTENSGGNEVYKLNLDGFGFESEKTTYARGEEVTVYYGIIATDTDYSFGLDCDDVRLNQDFDGTKGYVFTFKMPAHDVTLSVSAQNTMVRR